MTFTRKHFIITLFSVAALCIIAVALGLWLTRPERTVRAFLAAAKSQNEDKAMQYVSKDISEIRTEDITFFLEDWTFDDGMVYVLGKEHAAWRERDKTTTINGKQEVVKDSSGDPVKDFQPISQHVAHIYEQYATVAFDDYEDKVIIRLRRATKDNWSLFGQIFRKWEVVDIRYQPYTEDDFGDIDPADFFQEDDE